MIMPSIRDTVRCFVDKGRRRRWPSVRGGATGQHLPQAEHQLQTGGAGNTIDVRREFIHMLCTTCGSHETPDSVCCGLHVGHVGVEQVTRPLFHNTLQYKQSTKHILGTSAGQLSRQQESLKHSVTGGARQQCDYSL